MATYNDLSITPTEKLFIANKQLDKFWLSRLRKKDPIARIGYALWCPSINDLKREVLTGDPEYWNHKGYTFWEFMARSTVVNIAIGLEKAGFKGNNGEMRAKIKEVGLEVAIQHQLFVTADISNKYGKVWGLLSLEQVARYHHRAFQRFQITPDTFGGTWLSNIPDEIELKTYGDIYCHDCDSNEGFEVYRK